MRLFLCGDVMTGRGIDQVLSRHNEPRLYEPWVGSALEYVKLAEVAHGPLPRPLADAYVWGDLLELLAEHRPDVRIVNLETAVTTCDGHWPGKGIHYRMHPGNAGVLGAAAVDACVLANNHVLDWGRAGLDETLATLHRVGIASAGAGSNLEEATAPAAIAAAAGGRVLVFGFGLPSSGIPEAWEATPRRSGVSLLPDLSPRAVERVAGVVGRWRLPGDVVVVSLHWGGNWGYEIAAEEREFAHGVIAEAGADVVHGHSSHHPRGIEVFAGRLILYGCGDFLDDYEGIGGHEAFRADLVLAYFADLASDGRLTGLEMRPLRIRRLRLELAPAEDVEWLRATLDREGRVLGTGVRISGAGRLALDWSR